VILLDPDPGCLACKRERQRQRQKRDRRAREWQSSWYEGRNRGAKYRSGDRRRGETGEQSTEVGTEEEEEEMWGCVFLSFFFFPFVQDKGFFFSQHFRSCEFGTR
jgi:hypothetical protein